MNQVMIYLVIVSCCLLWRLLGIPMWKFSSYQEYIKLGFSDTSKDSWNFSGTQCSELIQCF